MKRPVLPRLSAMLDRNRDVRLNSKPMMMRASPQFAAWFAAERKRRNLSARELCEDMARIYAKARGKSKSVPWEET